ncbi:hypothetical protein R3W88_011814 [Solanum pinnatisectum]|uniref:DUF4283 domain-containing protein n=1 Tax=Solanum pinnatisectum TaxID=50273 RepID=A0AAV9L788_9SOLN|nr:hypothetical protein R3W88_011814 [Solanum pinnatisectum]
MAKCRKNVQQLTRRTGKMVTPANGLVQELSFLTFRRFIPLKYQLIEGGIETSSSNEDVQLKAFKAGCKETHCQMGKALNFIPLINRDGKIVVKIKMDDMKSQSEYWELSLIGYVIVSNNRRRDQILKSTPYTYRNKPLILRKWELNLTFTYELMSIIILWIKFTGLSVGYWSASALNKVVSSERISHARILIEVYVAQKLPDEVEIDTPYGVLKQHIQYDCKLSFCNDCLIFGHESDDFWYKEP